MNKGGCEFSHHLMQGKHPRMNWGYTWQKEIRFCFECLRVLSCPVLQEAAEWTMGESGTHLSHLH